MSDEVQTTYECAYCKTTIKRRPSVAAKSKSGVFFCSREHQGLGFRRSSGIDVSSGPKKTTGPYRDKADTPCRRCQRLRQSAYLHDGLCSQCSKIDTKLVAWLGGDITVTYSGKTKEPAEFVKRYVVELVQDRCAVCKNRYSRPDGTSIMQMNHIDGNYLNNHLSNLEILCPNHHAMTATWGSRNPSPGRRTIARELASNFVIDDKRS